MRGRRVLLRADFNVPLADGRITDDGRVQAALPTVRALTGAGARVVACSHLGRPKGAPDARYSLRPVADRLGELLGQPVELAADVAGDAAAATVARLEDGGVALLENLRFDPGETTDDPGFARRLASLADVYVDDAFGAVHRAHASVSAVAALLPHAAGLLVQREVEVLSRLTHDPSRPYTVVLGGSKVSDKLAVIRNLLTRVDRLLVGGGMCFTFLRAAGGEVGDSLLEPDRLDDCREVVAEAAERGVQLVLPEDVVAAAEVSQTAATSVVAADAVPPGLKGLDIGPRSARRFAELVSDAATVFWNGPMGVFEVDPFAAGTRVVAEAVARVRGLSVVGGGDSAAAIRSLGIPDERFGHVSTGGGASLEFLEGRRLPGLAALEG